MLEWIRAAASGISKTRYTTDAMWNPDKMKFLHLKISGSQQLFPRGIWGIACAKWLIWPCAAQAWRWPKEEILCLVQIGMDSWVLVCSSWSSILTIVLLISPDACCNLLSICTFSLLWKAKGNSLLLERRKLSRKEFLLEEATGLPTVLPTWAFQKGKRNRISPPPPSLLLSLKKKLLNHSETLI